jgi:hypothetical protein
MDELTLDEKTRAIKISQALQLFFRQNPGTPVLRSTEAYEILVTKNLVERDRYNGLFFRKLLHKLKANGALGYIPQCQPQPGNSGTTEWHFRSTPRKTILASKLRPIGTAPKPPADPNEVDTIRIEVARLPKRDTRGFNPIQLKKRKMYPRAYEFWSKKEEMLLVQAAKLMSDPFQLADLFGRQPSVLEERLKLLR